MKKETKKSILKKFESDKINQMQKITGGRVYLYTTGGKPPDGGGWYNSCGHGDYEPA